MGGSSNHEHMFSSGNEYKGVNSTFRKLLFESTEVCIIMLNKVGVSLFDYEQSEMETDAMFHSHFPMKSYAMVTSHLTVRS